MTLPVIIVNSIFGIIILTILGLNSSRNIENSSFSDRVYYSIIILIMIMLVFDVFSRFDGNPNNSLYVALNHIGNFLFFFLNPLMPTLWILYLYSYINHDLKKIKKLMRPVIIINTLYWITLLISLQTGWYYTITSANIYVRGDLYFISILWVLGLTLYSTYIVIKNHALIDKKHFFSMIVFPIPPILCSILQYLLYGYSFLLMGMIISLILVFMQIQNRNINTDYITGLYNRKKLDVYLQEKFNSVTKNKTFAMILLDIDDFKTINDRFGHLEGDKALEYTSMILKSCVENNAFIARYGGDEFCIIFDTNKQTNLDDVFFRLSSCINQFNQKQLVPYELEISYGGSVYDYDTALSLSDFQKSVDRLMYQNKQSRKNEKKGLEN